jgi:hypothetical protein
MRLDQWIAKRFGLSRRRAQSAPATTSDSGLGTALGLRTIRQESCRRAGFPYGSLPDSLNLALTMMISLRPPPNLVAVRNSPGILIYSQMVRIAGERQHLLQSSDNRRYSLFPVLPPRSPWPVVRPSAWLPRNPERMELRTFEPRNKSASITNRHAGTHQKASGSGRAWLGRLPRMSSEGTARRNNQGMEVPQ